MEKIIASFGIDWHIFTAEVVNFLVVIAILYWFVFRKIGAILDERKQTIEQGLSDADAAKAARSSAEEEKRQIIKAAETEASDRIAASVEIAKEREGEIVAAAESEAKAIIEKGRASGEREKESIVAGSGDELARLIVLGAEKALATK